MCMFYNLCRSHCGVVDKPLALQTKGRRLDSQLHQSVGRDFKPWPRLNMTLAVGGTLNTNATTTITCIFFILMSGWYLT